MDHYIRGRTWITGQFSEERVASRTDQKGSNFQYAEEEKQMWRENPAAYIQYRKGLEYELQTLYSKSQRGSDLQATSRAQYTAGMQARLKDKPELLDMLIPDFPPLCKRLTPGPGYLEALTADNISVVPTAITRIDEKGIITDDGKHRPVDAIICATGFQTSPGGGFPILGRGGVNLRHRYAQRPETYLGLCTDGFPNFFQSLGPNSFQGAGSLLVMMEQVHGYVAEILGRMAYDNIGIVEPKRKHVQNFTAYAEKYFERTVYTADCASWYKSPPPGKESSASLEERKRGRVTALWPGSSLHATKAMSKVRWEDFETTPYDGNEFGWFGNGCILGETGGNVQTEAVTWYLNETGFVDDIGIGK